jgi:hypothetical protein
MSDETPIPNEAFQGNSTPAAGTPKTSGMAIAALILGIVSIPLIFVCIGWGTALTGLVLGIIAIVQINGSDGQLKGKGMAISGVVTSILAVIIYGIFIAWIASSEISKEGFSIPELESAIEAAAEEASATAGETAEDSSN